MGIIDIVSEIKTTLDKDSEILANPELDYTSEIITTLDKDSGVVDELNLDSEVFNGS